MLWQWANNSAQVFILDLDGTLIPSAEIDNLCFWQAVFECFDRHDPLPDLHDFKHVTDSGILGEWCEGALGRFANDDENRQIRRRFAELLEQSSNEPGEYFKPLAGVEEWLLAVQESPNVFAGIATGGWGHSAGLKLELSGLDKFDLPLASSDDAIARSDIMLIAAGMVQELHGVQDAAITYIGDGAWDFEATRVLNWDFIGIAGGDQASRLRKAGANHVRADFTRL